MVGPTVELLHCTGGGAARWRCGGGGGAGGAVVMVTAVAAPPSNDHSGSTGESERQGAVPLIRHC